MEPEQTVYINAGYYTEDALMEIMFTNFDYDPDAYDPGNPISRNAYEDYMNSDN